MNWKWKKLMNGYARVSRQDIWERESTLCRFAQTFIAANLFYVDNSMHFDPNVSQKIWFLPASQWHGYMETIRWMDFLLNHSSPSKIFEYWHCCIKCSYYTRRLNIRDIGHYNSEPQWKDTLHPSFLTCSSGTTTVTFSGASLPVE